MVSLMQRLEECVSPYHTVSVAGQDLEEAGFFHREFGDSDLFCRGGRYYLTPHDGVLLALVIGEEPGPLRIAVCHGDSPCLKLKPNPDLWTEQYGRWNVETYGGARWEEWLDRPLLLSGRAQLRGADPFSPKSVLFAIKEPVGIIPSLAYHLSDKKPAAIGKQTELPPLVQMGRKPGSSFFDFLAEFLDCLPEQLLDVDGFLYPAQPPVKGGLHQELLFSPRLDNLVSVHACLKGILSCVPEDVQGVRVMVIFNHEEVGSRSKEGAASGLLNALLRRVYQDLEGNAESLYSACGDGFLLSVDVAHAHHPAAFSQKGDPTNPVFLGGGIVLKTAARQSYVGDSKSLAIIKGLCGEKGIPYQHYVNHSDLPGGSTIGPILSAAFFFSALDVGVPVLSMHAPVETMSCQDQAAAETLLMAFLS